jgi:hypothetical protein
VLSLDDVDWLEMVFSKASMKSGLSISNISKKIQLSNSEDVNEEERKEYKI